MKNEKILNSLRCCASVDGASCDNCNDEELGSDKLLPCSDVLKCLAANLIEKLTGRCARYAEEIAVLQERTRWVPVDERLPEIEEMVLVIVNGQPAENVTLIGALELATWPCCENMRVTHWMPLPEPPEVEG